MQEALRCRDGAGNSRPVAPSTDHHQVMGGVSHRGIEGKAALAQSVCGQPRWRRVDPDEPRGPLYAPPQTRLGVRRAVQGEQQILLVGAIHTSRFRSTMHLHLQTHIPWYSTHILNIHTAHYTLPTYIQTYIQTYTHTHTPAAAVAVLARLFGRLAEEVADLLVGSLGRERIAGHESVEDNR